MRRRIRPSWRGPGCQLHLPPEERQLLESLPSQLAEVLGSLDLSDGEVPGNLRRLFPRAYVSDEEAERSFAESTRAELAASHRRALETLAGTAQETVLGEEEMAGWLTALNDLRLVLGSALGVQEDQGWTPSPAVEHEFVIYQYLSLLQSELIDAMERTLPPPLPGADDAVPEDPWGEPLGGLRWDGTPLPQSPFGDQP